MYYVKSIHNPNKHALIPDDYPWYISQIPITNGIEITEEDFTILQNSFDLTAYHLSIQNANKTQIEVEEELQIKSAAYTGPGTLIAEQLEKKVWARNTYLKSIGQELTIQQMTALLQISIGVDKALRTGSLVTAKDGLLQLKTVLPQYNDIGDWAINALKLFIG